MSTARRALPLILTAVFVIVALVVVLTSLRSETEPGPAPTSAPLATTTPPAPSCPAAPGDRSGANDGDLKIGTIFPLTGRELDANGRQLTAAAELAGQDVAAAGGVPGLRVAPLGPETERDEGVPGSGTTCASVGALLAAGVDAIVGPHASVDTLATYRRVTGVGTLMMSPANTLTGLSTVSDRGLLFRTASSNALQGPVLADLVADEGNRDVAVVASSEPFAADLAGAIADGLARRSVPHVVLPYDPAAPRFNDIADTIVGRSVDAVVFVGFGEVSDLVRVLLGRGVTPANHRMYGATGFLVNTFAQQASPGAPELVAGFRGFVPWADPAFNARLLRFRPGLADLTYGAQAYDAVVTISLAAAATRSDDPARIAAALPSVTRGGQKCTSYAQCVGLLAQNPSADIDYDGVSGPLGFTPQGDPCQAVYVLSAFDTSSHLQGLRLGTSTDQCT